MTDYPTLAATESALHQVVSEIELRGAFRGIRLRVERSAFEPPLIFAEWLVPSRDTGAPIWLECNVPLPPEVMQQGVRAIVRFVYNVVAELVSHELAESFRHRGELPFDPHAGEERDASRA